MEEESKTKLSLGFDKLKQILGSNKVVYLLLAIFISFGVYVRTLNLDQLKDKYLLALDPYVFLRYAEHIVEHGSLMAQDYMRYYPRGISTSNVNPVLPYTLAYLHKFLSIFFPGLTIEQTTIIYPVIFFALSCIVFFLLVQKLFKSKAVSLIATGILAIIPSFLYRTMAGFADKSF